VSCQEEGGREGGRGGVRSSHPEFCEKMDRMNEQRTKPKRNCEYCRSLLVEEAGKWTRKGGEEVLKKQRRRTTLASSAHAATS